ncbi:PENTATRICOPEPTIDE REPEAT-CONTAINING PROTEIN PET309 MITOCHONDRIAL [Salix koriyanagi]|uniref:PENTATRICOPEPTIDE REPEAT-CONTAINING PROTEIN PET309 MITOCHONDRIAL n=1 Tax=Salix koriyanagi TaxID=2511006 RepID=A0A9Q0UPL9_9ROSI|nr:PENTATRICOPEPTIDE REPEAT-CONTAINING PROTEIN PET309 MITOCHONDRIAL [Salix koriyanagi]
MKRRVLTILLPHVTPYLSSHKSQPISLSSFHSQSYKLSSQNPKKSRQNSIFITTRFIFTSPSDNLEGMVDPNDPLLQVESRVEAFSSEEFAFLRDSLLSPSEDRQRFDLGKCSNEATLIANVILNNNDGFGNQTLKLLREHREKLNPNLVVEVLNIVKIPELCVNFFIWAGRQIGYYHTLPVYNALLDILESSSKNNIDRVPEKFLREIMDDDKQVLGKLLNVLIRKCCQNGLWNAALEELGRLKDFGYKPSRLTYNALVQVFLRADRIDSAYLVHREMSTMGYSMDEFTLGCFVHSLCKSGKWREALSLLEKEEFVPDTVLYTKMISGLCEASLFEEAMDFLTRMRASSCLPNVLTYRILLCGCLNKEKLGRCKRILSMMITEGCYPSHRIFNSLVHAYCRSGDYAYAYKLLKKMVQCGCQPGYVVYNIFIGGICSNEEPSKDALDLAEKAYGEMLEAGVVLNKVNIGSFSRCLCGVGKFEKAYNVIHEMMGKGFIPDTSTYSKVIGYLCNASKVEKAFQLFQEMKRNGIAPDVYVYTTLIDSFCKAGLIEQARNWFDEMERDGCVPNVVTYTALIHAYLKSRKLSKANEVYEMMLSKGCTPNIVTYTALIDGLCKAGKIEKASQIYKIMKKENVEIPDVDMYFRVVDGSLNEPNVFTYGALVDGLCKAYQVKEARDLLKSMSVEGCEPNHVVYDALIDGCCKAGKLDEAQEVFTKMLECGYDPNVFTYSSLIDRLFKDKRLDLALKVLSKMLENSCAPNVVIYTEMIDGLCKVGKTDEAYKLMIMMEEKGCNPNVVTYTAMIDGFGKAGRVEKCLELMQQMSSKGCAPNFVTYRVLINHCCSAGLLDEAHKLLEEMKQTYWPRHVAGYRKVIEGFNREFIASLDLSFEISENDSVPVAPVYRVLIDNFIKAGRLEMALELNEELSSFSPFSAANQNINITLIENLSLAHKADKAFELYADMIGRGSIPELSILVHLVKGLLRVNRWEEALQLLDSICQMVYFLNQLLYESNLVIFSRDFKSV